METKIGESTLPQAHEDQMELGHKIIHNAFHGHKSVLQQECRNLKITNDELRSNLAALQKKNSALEVELVESHQRAQQLAEENKELFKTVGSLRKQIGRLEHLKAAVLSSIQDDAEKEAEMGDTRAFLSEEYLTSATPITSREMGLGMGGAMGYQQQQFGQRGLSGMGAPAPLPSSTPGALGGGGGGAPGAASPVIDGKAFFRQARSRLSHEAFNQFLASIKRLNNQQQTREETLEQARTLFGPELGDLYSDFETLLNRQGML